MNEGRRPITDDERPHLVALGHRVRALRTGARFTQARLAVLSGVSRQHVMAIELGRRRTRRATLERLVDVLVDDPAIDATVAELVDLAGPALAPAPRPDHAERVERRRRRRERASFPQRIAELERQLAKVQRERRGAKGIAAESFDALVAHAERQLAELRDLEAERRRSLRRATGSRFQTGAGSEDR